MIGPRGRAWLVAGAIFSLGVAMGGAGTAWAGIRVLRQALQSPASAPGAADRAAARIGADLTQSLQLTPEQSTRVQAILDRSAASLKTLRVTIAAEVRAELRASTEKIALELPPEKRPELYRVITKRFERLGLPPPVEPQKP